MVYQSVFLYTLCDSTIISLLNLRHSDKWQMLSCHFNLLVLIICEVNPVLIGHSFFMSCIFSSFSHYSLDYSSFPGRFVRAYYSGDNFAIYHVSCRYFPRIVLYIFDIVYCIFAIWSVYFKMRKYWTRIGFTIPDPNYFLESFKVL